MQAPGVHVLHQDRHLGHSSSNSNTIIGGTSTTYNARGAEACDPRWRGHAHHPTTPGMPAVCSAVLCCALLCSAGAGAGASASASAGAARACVVASVRQREATSKARTWHLAGASKTHSLRAAGAGAGQARARWGVGITQTPKGWTHLAGLPAHVCAVKVDDVGGVKLAAQNPPAEWHAGSGIIYLS